MNQMPVLDRVMDILKEDYPLAKPDDTFAAMGMDSLDYLAMVCVVERRFGADVPRGTHFDRPMDIVAWLEEVRP
jgi:acyl carrier protein